MSPHIPINPPVSHPNTPSTTHHHHNKTPNQYTASLLRSLETAAIAQSGSNSYPAYYDPNSGVFPLWRVGLQGQGQIVGMGDSGLDMQSCFFNDPNHPDPGLHHRKVISYRAALGDGQDVSGHGTHTAGTLGGAVLGGGAMASYNGIAPMVKIAFTDLGTIDPSMCVVGVLAGVFVDDVCIQIWGFYTHKYTHTHKCIMLPSHSSLSSSSSPSHWSGNHP